MRITIYSLFIVIILSGFYFSIQAQWVQLNLDTTFSTSGFIIKDTYLFTGTGKDLFISSNNGNSWIPKGFSGARCFALKNNDLFVGTYSGVYHSTDNGNYWTQVNNGITDPYGKDVMALAVSGINIFAGTADYVFITTDDGTNWTQVNNGLGRFIQSLAVNGSYVFAGHGDGQGIFRSSNNGINWTQKNTGLPSGTSVPEIAVYNGNIYAGTYTGVYKSSNDGESWEAISNGLTYLDVRAFAFAGNNLFAGINDNENNNGGVFISSNNGANWIAVNDGLGNKHISSLIIHNDYIFAGTYQITGSVWRRPLSEIVTTVEQSNILMPSIFYLKQNYPNPFNPTTKISYSIKEEGLVTLKVYDILGKEIVTIVNENKPEGIYEVEFNASQLPNGMYIYKLQAGGFSDVKKMLLLK